MKYDSTCSCGARLVVEWDRYENTPIMRINDWIARHKDCKPVVQLPPVQVPPFVPFATLTEPKTIGTIPDITFATCKTEGAQGK